MVLTVTCKIDTKRLNAGIALALRYTKRTPAQAVNTAACEIAITAKNTMPFVTAQRIDAELGAVGVPRLGSKGQPLQQFTKSGKSVAKNKTYHGTMMGRYEATKNIPLTVLIMIARSNPESNYNLTTGGRYALARNPMAGFSRALGLFKMRTLIDNMIKARHRSGHFLMAGWIPAVRALLPLSVNKWRRGSSAAGPPLEGQQDFYGADLGDALPALEGSTMALCIITNNLGYEGKNSFNFNKALWEHGALPLQRAVDDEGVKQMQYFLDKSGEELVVDMNAAWK